MDESRLQRDMDGPSADPDKSEKRRKQAVVGGLFFGSFLLAAQKK